MRVRLALIVLVAISVRAEQNCGEIYRYATNFRATVHSVEMLGLAKMRTVEPYDRWLEVGPPTAPRWSAVRSIRAPECPCINLAAFPGPMPKTCCPDDDRRRTIVVEVTAQHIDNQGDGTWINVLRAAIRDVR